jgi:hypothetical protein
MSEANVELTYPIYDAGALRRQQRPVGERRPATRSLDTTPKNCGPGLTAGAQSLTCPSEYKRVDRGIRGEPDAACPTATIRGMHEAHL